jgi:intracellular septation protein A
MAARLFALGAVALTTSLLVAFVAVVTLAWLATLPLTRLALLSGLVVFLIGGVWWGLR